MTPRIAAVVLALVLPSVACKSQCPTCPEVKAAAPVPVPAVGNPSTTGETAKAFTKTYDTAIWGTNDAGKGNSGTGSTMRATVVYRAFLQQFLADNAIKSAVDAGCGDWEFSHTINWTGIDYKGYDIVETVVAADKTKYAAPNIQFFVGNIVDDDLPPADLLISKHVLQHLPTADVLKFLKQTSKYKHVLLTNGVDAVTLGGVNTDIKVGDYRTIDLNRPPFNVAGAKVLTFWDGNHMSQVVHITNAK